MLKFESFSRDGAAARVGCLRRIRQWVSVVVAWSGYRLLIQLRYFRRDLCSSMPQSMGWSARGLAMVNVCRGKKKKKILRKREWKCIWETAVRSSKAPVHPCRAPVPMDTLRLWSSSRGVGLWGYVSNVGRFTNREPVVSIIHGMW